MGWPWHPRFQQSRGHQLSHSPRLLSRDAGPEMVPMWYRATVVEPVMRLTLCRERVVGRDANADTGALTIATRFLRGVILQRGQIQRT